MKALPLHELQHRWDRCRQILKQFLPETGGIILFSRLNIYYFSGTFVNGLLWLPLEGKPVLLCRRGFERAKLESPLERIYPFYGYKEVEGILRDAGSPLSKTFAAEMNGLSWSLGSSFTRYLSGYNYVPGDRVVSITRGRKTDRELEILREAGIKHGKCLTELLPSFIREGMTELEIAHVISNLFFQEGHHGILRMETYGEEVYLGHISVGDSANYPSVFNGPVGLRGVHPATPYMGSSEIEWKAGLPLTIDCGFTLEGYQTDKTQVYWLGERSGIPSDAQTAHNFCIELQQWLAEHLKPGMLPSELWQYSIMLAERHGWSEGFMGLDNNKVNFVGHGIGLAVDEYPVLADGFDLPLEAGMVLAIEPKIGIPNVGMVGVENTFEVTPAGGRCLTGENYDIICISE